MRRIGHTPIDDDAETAGIRPLEACVSLSTEGNCNISYFGFASTVIKKIAC